MKRHIMDDQKRATANWEMSKKQKTDSASNIIQEQVHYDCNTNEVTEGKETVLLDEENLETDGEKAVYIKGQSRMSDDGRKRILKDGFGFDKKTAKFRTVCKEKSMLNQCYKVCSVDINVKHGVDGASGPGNNQKTSKLSRKESEDNLKKLEASQNAANNTHNKHIAKTATNTKAEPPEMDVIYTRQLQEWKLPNPPKQAPSDYADQSPGKLPPGHGAKFCGITFNKKKPDQETNILIPHKYADKPEGDSFGAILCTYEEHMDHGRIYYRHFFEKVILNQPAAEMKIENDDELVLLNDVFAPDLQHTAVLNLFHHVKVDGETRFSLVIRRKRTKQKWDWIETSAVLAPEKQIDIPAVTGLRYSEVSGDQTIYRPASKHLYKAPGSNKYIDIRDGEVRMDTMDYGNNKTKIIWKHPKFWQVGTEGHIEFATTLCDQRKKWYIVMNEQEQIVVGSEPIWFKMINIGSKIRFQFQKLYLGYNTESNRLQAQTSNCVFEELPAPSVDKADEVSFKHVADTRTEDVQNSAEQLSRTRPLHLHVRSSDICKGSDRSSDVASLSSADSGASGFDFTRSCSSGTDNSNRLSFTSETSGYRTSTPEGMDINTPDEVGRKFSTTKFPWCSYLVPAKTPTTPMKNLDLDDSAVD